MGPVNKSQKTRDGVQKSTKTKKPEYTLDDLISKAEGYIESLDFDLAHKFAKKAVSISPDNCKCLELLGTISMETGDIDTAIDSFNRICKISPTITAHVYLGQLSSGQEAIRHYQNGISLIQKEIETLMDDSSSRATAPSRQPEHFDTIRSLSRQLSTAYCSIAEIFMTDCCYEPDAERRCQECVELAMTADPSNPDAYHSKASLLLSQQKPEEAKSVLYKACQMWIPTEVLSVLSGFEDIDTAGDDSTLIEIPAYQSRIALVKLLLELNIKDLSMVVLQTCRDEDDEALEMWYLYGMCYWLLGRDLVLNGRSNVSDSDEFMQAYVEKVSSGEEQLSDEVAEHWVSSLECLEEAKKIIIRDGLSGDELIQNIKDLYETLLAVSPQSKDVEMQHFKLFLKATNRAALFGHVDWLKQCRPYKQRPVGQAQQCSIFKHQFYIDF